MTATVYKFPFCCRRKMIYQPARIRWYCKTCGKLMPRGEEYTPPPPLPEWGASVLLTDTPIV